MKKEKSSASGRKVSVTLSQDEFYDLQGKHLHLGYLDVNDYLRDLILQGLIEQGYRNPSIDEFTGVVIGLKNELNAIGTNFNQAVRRLHQTYYPINQKEALEFYDKAQNSLFHAMEEIKAILGKAYEKCEADAAEKKNS